MSPLIALLAGLLLAGAGGLLLVAGRRETSRSGIDRLRAVLDEGPATEQERSHLAAAWSELTRAADRAGGRTGAFVWLRTNLERAGLPLRPAEAAVGGVGFALVGALAGGVLAGGLAAALVGAVIGTLAPLAWLLRRAGRVTAKVDRQLPDVLAALASSLRSGHSLLQAVEAASERTPHPLGPQLSRVVHEMKLGRSLEDALEAMADRLGSTDLRWSVRAMIIQSRTGGRLADILETLAEFMREREEVRREVVALTADGRLSAWILSLLPFGVAGALLVMSPDYLTPLIEQPAGLVMIAVAAGLMLVAILWIRRVVRVEV